MSIKHLLPLVALLCLQTPALAAHSGSAPTDPSKPDDEHFMVDTDTGLDTGCTFRGGGPLRFKVKIDRYVGKVKGDGTLENPGLLTQQGVISRTVELKMPAYDIDFSDGEIDEVYFNGHKLGTLQGSDGTWYENQFTVPIEWVKFPAARGENGQKPTAAENEIQIDIDKNNEGWCAAIDWAEMHFKAMAPLLLIHGIGANPEAAWEVEPGVIQHLTNLGIPFEHRIQIGPNNLIFPDPVRRLPGNAQILEGEIRTVAQSFGVQKVHLVAHSKGGLDSRGYFSRFYHPEEVRVVSFHTVSTPHQGSVLADISVLARTRFPRPMPPEGDDEMATYLTNDFYFGWVLGGVVGRGPQRPGLDNLQTEFMQNFNRDSPFPSEVKFYTYGADADLPPRDGNITVAEAPSLLPHFPPVFDAGEQGTVLYYLLRDVSTVRLIEERLPFPPRIVFRRELGRVPTTSPQLNDLAVTDTSSQHPSQLQHFSPSLDESDPSDDFLQNNHRRVKNPELINSILNTIRRNFPVN